MSEQFRSLWAPWRLFDRLVDAEEVESVPPEAVAARTQQWVALCGLLYRLLAAPVPLLGFVGEVGLAAPTPTIAGAMVLVTLANLALMLEVLVRRSVSILHGRVVMPLDCVVAAGLNLWLSALLAPGSLEDAFRDVFWFYALGTVALWGGLHGLRTGVFLIVAAVPLQWGMYRLNGYTFDQVSVMHVAARLTWMLLIMVTVLIVAHLVRLGARVALAAGIRAGRQAEQLALLRSMHDTVLQSLEAIALQAGQRPVSEQRMRQIETASRGQAAALRAMLSTRPGPTTAPRRPPDDAGDGTDGLWPTTSAALAAAPREPVKNLVTALREAVERASGRGLTVELVTAEATVQPSPVVTEALAQAVGEALTNVAKHAGVGRAVVRVVTSPDGVEVTVRDHGCGFDADAVRPGFGIPQSITARMRELGGDAVVSSRPGRGTRVRLRSPARASSSPCDRSPAGPLGGGGRVRGTRSSADHDGSRGG